MVQNLSHSPKYSVTTSIVTITRLKLKSKTHYWNVNLKYNTYFLGSFIVNIKLLFLYTKLEILDR